MAFLTPIFSEHPHFLIGVGNAILYLMASMSFLLMVSTFVSRATKCKLYKVAVHIVQKHGS